MRKSIHSYVRERHKGRTVSATLHGMLLLFVIFGLPDFLKPEPPEEPVAISVELLPISAISNVKPSESPPQPEAKPEEKQPEQKKPSPPVKTAADTPPPPPEAVPLPDKPKEKKPAEKKPEPKEKKEEPKPEKKEKKPKEDPLAAILKSVKSTAQKEKKDEKKDKKPVEEAASEARSLSSQYDPSMQVSMSEKDAIVSQISKCWNVPAGAKDAQDLVVVIRAQYNPDGSYVRAEVAAESRGRYQSDSFFRAAADSALRAVQRCSPLTGLPPDKYNGWRDMELRFDPRMMLN